MLKAANRGWNYDGTVFYVQPVDANLHCPDGYIGVNRAYNQGVAHFDSNHRYSTSDSTCTTSSAKAGSTRRR